MTAMGAATVMPIKRCLILPPAPPLAIFGDPVCMAFSHGRAILHRERRSAYRITAKVQARGLALLLGRLVKAHLRPTIVRGGLRQLRGGSGNSKLRRFPDCR